MRENAEDLPKELIVQNEDLSKTITQNNLLAGNANNIQGDANSTHASLTTIPD
jgi:hypothetical protein